MRAWRSGWAGAVVALAGCASLPAPSPDLPLTATGRLSVQVEASGERPAQSLVAAFEWRGGGERGELALMSPLGTQLGLARWSPGQATLDTPQGRSSFGNLDDLAERALGERLPLAAWPDWLAGRPWPGAPSGPLVPAGNGFEQLGWAVDLSQLPQHRIEARRSAPPPVRVRVVLDAVAGPGTPCTLR